MITAKLHAAHLTVPLTIIPVVKGWFYPTHARMRTLKENPRMLILLNFTLEILQTLNGIKFAETVSLFPLCICCIIRLVREWFLAKSNVNKKQQKQNV